MGWCYSNFKSWTNDCANTLEEGETMREKIEALIRNNYYFGKLLSVKDFQLEQAYHIKRMELLCQIVLDQGQIKGLTVKKDDQSLQKIILDAGVAIEKEGKLIVVPDQVHYKLSEINGFDLDRDSEVLILSIHYHEQSFGEGFSLDREQSSIKEKNYNQTIESYELLLSETKPQKGLVLAKVHIDQIGSDYEIRLVEKAGQELSSNENSGDIDMELKENKIVKSRAIEHGLGLGDIQVTLSATMLDDDQACSYQGHQSLLGYFDEDELEYGFILYPDKGSFTILSKSSNKKKINFKWHARKSSVGGQKW